MDDIQVSLTLGPAYFGDPKLIRDVFEIITQAAMGHRAKIVTDVRNTKDPAVGLFAEIATTAHPDAPKQIAASIRSAMLLPASVPIEIIFEETDVMQEVDMDILYEAVTSAQRSLRRATDQIGDRIANPFWW